jgi:hypothetical protein
MGLILYPTQHHACFVHRIDDWYPHDVIQSNLIMKRRGRTKVSGLYEAVLELADSLNTQLPKPEGSDHKALPVVSEAILR